MNWLWELDESKQRVSWGWGGHRLGTVKQDFSLILTTEKAALPWTQGWETELPTRQARHPLVLILNRALWGIWGYFLLMNTNCCLHLVVFPVVETSPPSAPRVSYLFWPRKGWEKITMPLSAWAGGGLVAQQGREPACLGFTDSSPPHHLRHRDESPGGARSSMSAGQHRQEAAAVSMLPSQLRASWDLQLAKNT